MEAIVNIFDKMNIKNSIKYAMELEKKYSYKIRRYFTNDDVMIGGGNEITEFTFDNKIFNFYRTSINDTIHYKLFKNDDEEDLPECLYIIVDKTEKLATLFNIVYDKRCFDEKMKKEYKLCGSLLLVVGLKFIKVLRKKYDIKYVQLTDDSDKFCGKIPINFSLMHTLLYGETWYGSKGFKPKIKNVFEINEFLLTKYNKNKSIMGKTMVSDMPQLKKYLKNAYEEVNPKNISLKKIMEMYDNNKNNTLSSFLLDYMYDFKITCEMFSLFYRQLADDIGIYDFNDKPFIHIF